MSDLVGDIDRIVETLQQRGTPEQHEWFEHWRQSFLEEMSQSAPDTEKLDDHAIALIVWERTELNPSPPGSNVVVDMEELERMLASGEDIRGRIPTLPPRPQSA